jgi:hypothetical protein
MTDVVVSQRTTTSIRGKNIIRCYLSKLEQNDKMFKVIDIIKRACFSRLLKYKKASFICVE